MTPFQDIKVNYLFEPEAIKDNASCTSSEVDTKGWDYGLVIVGLGATDIAMAALYLRETDTSGSGQAEITDLDFSDTTLYDIDGVAAGLPTAADDNLLFGMLVDLRYRKRYIDIVATAGNGTNGTYAFGIMLLGRGDIIPNTAAEMGLHQCLEC